MVGLEVNSRSWTVQVWFFNISFSGLDLEVRCFLFGFTLGYVGYVHPALAKVINSAGHILYLFWGGIS